MSKLKTQLTDQNLIYLDTSAYICLLLGEEMSSQIELALMKKALCSSSYFVLEVERNLVRLCREKLITENMFLKSRTRLEHDLKAFALKDLTLEICQNSSFPAVKTPRSSDLIHLRTAQWFLRHENLAGFITLDQHQIEAAQELKLPIIRLD